VTRAEAEAVAALIIPSPLYVPAECYALRKPSRVVIATARYEDGKLAKRIVAVAPTWLEALQTIARKLEADDRRDQPPVR
jgi:hypothetical protein